MKFIPAIDLKEGKCVRLAKGEQESSIIYNSEPIKQARFFEKEGCKRIHIVDLDAAFGNQINNKSTILDIRNSISIEIELGGGIKTEKDASFWIKNGINYLIFGSVAINKPKIFEEIIKEFANMLYVSIDDYNGSVMINGWKDDSKYKTNEIFNIYNESKIRGFIFTDIARDGMLKGINIDKIKKCLKLSKKPIIVGGGLSSNNELEILSQLEEPLLEGVIAGKSFYQGRIDIKTIKHFLD